MEFFAYPITAVVTIVTAIVSLIASEKPDLKRRMLLSPYAIVHQKQYERIFSHALIHSDILHLIFNMYVFYEFGHLLEFIFTNETTYYQVFGNDSIYWGDLAGSLYFALLYVGAIAFATLPSMRRHKGNPAYTALGASGGVSAIVMAYILLFPTNELRFILFPFFGIPAFIIGVFFFAYESYMDKKGGGRIAHDAHLFGALFCLLFFLIVDSSVYLDFYHKVLAFFQGN